MTILEQYACIYSDRFKDAYGFRPRGNETADWNEIQYLAEFARLNEIVDRQIAEEF